MPKLVVGAGIARGAQAFVTAYQQGKQYENQEKQQKNAVILQALFSQLQDDNIPYAKRAAILDSIPGLIGAKIQTPLSHQFGLHDLLDQDVQIGETSGTTGTPASSQSGTLSARDIGNPYDPNQVSTSSPELTTSVSQQATQGTQAVPTTEKFGDLSPARYKQLITHRQKKLDDADELQHQEALLRIQQNLSDESYAKRGWDRNGDWFLDDKTGEWVQNYYNPQTGQSRQQRIKDVIPLDVIKAKMRGTNLPGPARVYKTYYETQINPLTGVNYTDDEAEAKAAEHYTKYADVTAGLKAAQAEETLKRTKQTTSGTQPESPHEAATRQDAAENRRIAREQIHSTMESQAMDAEGTITGIQAKVRSQEELVNTLQNGFDGKGNDDSITENYTKGDPEYAAAENELTRQKRALADMKADLVSAQSKAGALRKRADSYKASISDASLSGLTREQQAKVNIVKANPKNKDAIVGKSDAEIWNMIQAQVSKKK